MTKCPRLTTEQRLRVVVLNKEGYSTSELVIKLKFGRTVQEIIKKYKEQGAVKDRAGRGFKWKTTFREDRTIVNAALKARRKSPTASSRGLVAHFWLEIRPRTVIRR